MKKITSFLAFSLSLAFGAFSQNIYTIAGNGAIDYSGNGGQATAAQFYNPNAIARDTAGNIYIADQGNNCVRRIDGKTGVTTIFAGTTVPGYSGENLQATAAKLNAPSAVATDIAGNVYICDEGNNLIREVNISTHKINYIVGYVLKGVSYAGFTGDGGLADSAKINHPDGIAVSGSNIYFSDLNNQRIRLVSGGIISTICGRDSSVVFSGDGKAAFLADIHNPAGLAVDSKGNIYIGDMGNNRIRVINSGGIINTFAGNGTAGYNSDNIPANNAELNGPSGVAVDPSGNVYIADKGNNRVRMVPANDTIYTMAGNGTASYGGDGGMTKNAILNGPSAVVADNHPGILVLDANNFRVRAMMPNDTIMTVAGCGTGGYSANWDSALTASIRYPNGIALDKAGNLYFADKINNVVRKIRKKAGGLLQNGIIATVAGNGTLGYSGDGHASDSAMLHYPMSVAVDTSGNIYIADAGNNVVRKVDTTTGMISTYAGTGVAGFSGDNGPATAAQLSTPVAVACDIAGNVYVADNYNYRIRKITKATGNITTIAGTATQGYNGDNILATAAELSSPVGLAVDASNNIYVADNGQEMVRKISSANGHINTIAGNGFIGYTGDAGPATAAELSGPIGVSVDGSGNVFVADVDNNVIREIKSTGTIVTVAGTGIAGFFGDGGPATAAKLGQPQGVAVDNSGHIYITDYLNHRIREVTNQMLNGIEELSLNSSEIMIYPNPSSGKFNVALPQLAHGEMAEMEVYNVLGKKVASFACRESLNEIDMSTQPAGLYLYRVMSQTGNMIGTGKIVVQK